MSSRESNYRRALKKMSEHKLVWNYHACFNNALHAPSEQQRDDARFACRMYKEELVRRDYAIPELTHDGAWEDPRALNEAMIRCLERGDCKPVKGETLAQVIHRLRTEKINEWGGGEK